MAWGKVVLGMWLLIPSPQTDGRPPMPPPVVEAVEEVRRGRYTQALASAEKLRHDLPGSPLPLMIAAEAQWGLIYCETGQITDEHVWYVADRKSSHWDPKFFEAVEGALGASRAAQSDPATAAVGSLYSGLAYGIRARLYALRQQTSKSAADGKRMRSDLLEAVRQNPQLLPDANLGLGAYNYYADVLSPWLKIIRFFLRIPGGDRQKGLEQLRIAMAQGHLVATEAKFELARIYGIQEKRPTESFHLFQELSQQYPENALYVLSAAYQAEISGDRSTALEYAHKAADAAKKMEGDCQARFGEAARGALERLRQELAAEKTAD